MLELTASLSRLAAIIDEDGNKKFMAASAVARDSEQMFCLKDLCVDVDTDVDHAKECENKEGRYS